MGKAESKLSFLSQHFYRALAIFEPQIYVVSEQFEAENISLLSGRLVLERYCTLDVLTATRKLQLISEHLSN